MSGSFFSHSSSAVESSAEGEDQERRRGRLRPWERARDWGSGENLPGRDEQKARARRREGGSGEAQVKTTGLMGLEMDMERIVRYWFLHSSNPTSWCEGEKVKRRERGGGQGKWIKCVLVVSQIKMF